MINIFLQWLETRNSISATWQRTDSALVRCSSPSSWLLNCNRLAHRLVFVDKPDSAKTPRIPLNTSSICETPMISQQCAKRSHPKDND